MAELNWSDAQWQKVSDCVTEAFGKASVASTFLPRYGPLAGSTETVRNERLDDASTPLTVTLDADHDAANLKLVNLTVKVELSSEQVAEEALSNAMLAFRRAANILALQTDQIVFKGFGRGDPDSPYVLANAIKPQKGLADLPARFEFPSLAAAASQGEAVVSTVVNAIQRLENSSNPEPFACVLGNSLFEAVHTPTPSMVLPADRIAPLLKGGPLLRSGQMDPDAGIVVSLAANAVDIVVGTPPTVQFLQRRENAKFLFRVYQRFVLRIRDEVKPPVAGFTSSSLATRVVQALTLEALATREALVPLAELAVAEAKRRLAEALRNRG
jgi:uncharacterized linocin/CFP29 family protein